MKLTSDEIAKLRQIIEDRHTAFAIKIYGKRVVPQATYDRLKAAGLVTDKDAQAAADAFNYGRILQALNSPDAANMSYAAFGAYLRANPIPLSDVEKRAVGLAAARGAQYIVGLGNKISTQTGQLLIEADANLRNRLKEDIRDQVARGLASRETVQRIKSDIGHKTGDWTRDLDRIAATEVSMAMNEGLAAQLEQDHGDEAEVAVRSRRGCCEQCQAAYTGPDGAPIIFRLKDLQANGTNVGKKRPDQKPVVPPYHPNCLRDGTLVLTARGPERIEYITPGTFVYTHEGRLKRVTHTWSTFYEGPLHMVALGTGFTVGMTPNHELLLGEEWVQAQDLREGDSIHKCYRVYQDHGQNLGVECPKVLDIFYGGHGGAPLTAIILDSGVFVTGAVCHRDRPGVPIRAAFDGTLTFCAPSGVPAIYAADHAILQGSEYVGMDGQTLLFDRADKRAAQAVLAAQDYFRGFHKNRLTNRRTPTPPVDGNTSDPGMLHGPITLDCHVTVGISAASLVQKLDGGPSIPTPEGRAEFAQEMPIDFYIKPYRGMVHNLTVEEDNSYLAHGIIVHNCACTLVQVPKGHGFNADNRMTPLGTRGVRPHAAEKSLAQDLQNLRKAQNGYMLDWFGVPVTGVAQASTPGHTHGSICSTQGPVPCLMGPALHASHAFVVRLPHTDHVVLGHHSPESAALALSHETGVFVDPQASNFYRIGLPELALQVGHGPKRSDSRIIPDLNKAHLQASDRLPAAIRKPLAYARPKLPAALRDDARVAGPKDADPRRSGGVALPQIGFRELQARGPRRAVKPVVEAPNVPRVKAPALPRAAVHAPVATTTPSEAQPKDAKPKKPKARSPVLNLPKKYH